MFKLKALLLRPSLSGGIQMELKFMDGDEDSYPVVRGISEHDSDAQRRRDAEFIIRC